MLGALSKLFRKQSRMQAVDVYYVGGVYYVATEFGAGGSDPCFLVGPVSSVARSDVMERQTTLDNPSEAAPGEVVMSELELARQIEGPA